MPPLPVTPGRPRRSGRPAPALAALLTVGLTVTLTGCLPWRSAPPFGHLGGLGLDPADPAVLYLATDAGLYRLRARRWEAVSPALNLTALAVSSGEPGVLYGTGHPGPGLDLPDPLGVVVSRDSGRTWEPLALAGETDLQALAVSPIDPQLLYGWADQLYRSEDGGATWDAIPAAALAGEDTPGPFALPAGVAARFPGGGRGPFALVPHPRERDQLLAATAGGLKWSPDRGERWQTLLPGPVTAAAYSLQDPRHILAYHLEDGLVESRNGGRTWTPLGFRPRGEDPVTQIAIHPQNPAVIYVATLQGVLLRSADGGRHWKVLARPASRQGRSSGPGGGTSGPGSGPGG